MLQVQCRGLTRNWAPSSAMLPCRFAYNAARHRLPAVMAGALSVSTTARPTQMYPRQVPDAAAAITAEAAEQAAGAARNAPAPATQSWQELHGAARLAQLSGLCYAPTDEMIQGIKAEGLELIAHGRNESTSWFVADGVLKDGVQHLRSISEAIVMSSSNGAKRETLRRASDTSALQRGNTSPSAAAAPLAAISASSLKREAQPEGLAAATESVSSVGQASSTLPLQQRQRFVCFRGVQWSATDVQTRQLMSQLMRVGPKPFAPALTTPPGALTAHAGVLDLVIKLLPTMMPYIMAGQSPLPLCFLGHSLGGSIAMLLWCLAHVNRFRSSDQLSCFTFGSPPVLAHREGGGGTRVLSALGADASRCHNYVLEYDPIPQSMQMGDPLMSLAKRVGPVQELMQWRSRVLGQGSVMSSERFIFETVGRLWLVRRLDDSKVDEEAGGCEVSAVSPTDLKPAMEMILEKPQQALQLWLDHQYSSYQRDLASAARLSLRMQLRQKASHA